MNFRSSWLAWGALAVGAAIAGFWLARQMHGETPQLTSGTWFPQPRPVGELTLTGDDGKPFGRERLEGAPTLVFFGFTHCPDVCPTTMARLAQITKAAGVKDLRVLLISVDPERDTPENMHQYVRAFDPAFIGATGTPGSSGPEAKTSGTPASGRLSCAADRSTLNGSESAAIRRTRSGLELSPR